MMLGVFKPNYNMTNVIIESNGQKISDELSFEKSSYHLLVNPNIDVHFLVIKRSEA